MRKKPATNTTTTATTTNFGITIPWSRIFSTGCLRGLRKKTQQQEQQQKQQQEQQ